MKKSIYVITNKINNKRYVGQSIDPQKRFKEHKNNRPKYKSLIYDAIQKYGEENFTIEILESNIDNYNEREVYWINFFDSIRSGYNICKGGKACPIMYGVNHPNSRINKSDLIKIDQLLKNTSLSYLEIAKTIKTSKRTVIRINEGISYKRNLNYPIRKIKNNKAVLSDTEVLEIHNLLKFSYLNHSEIAKLYKIEKTVVLKIEKGKTIAYKLKEESYPLRDYKSAGKSSNITYNQVSEVYNLLLYTDKTLVEIETITKVPYQTIVSIKNGRAKRFCRKGYVYPLQSNLLLYKNEACIDYPPSEEE